MNLRTIWLTAIAPLLFAVLSGTAGADVDPIVQLFNQGQTDAVARIGKILPCSFPTTVTEDVKYWILTNQGSLANDLQNSPHMWVTDVQPTCTYTQATAMAPITLSYPACRQNVTTVDGAGIALIRESAHHLGVIDENTVTAIASAVYATIACPSTGDDPFDPGSCAGPEMTLQQAATYFTPGTSTSADFAHPQLYDRIRTCNTLTGCAPWQEQPGPVSFLYYLNGSLEKDAINTSGRAYLTTGMNAGSPDVYLNVDVPGIAGSALWIQSNTNVNDLPFTSNFLDKSPYGAAYQVYSGLTQGYVEAVKSHLGANCLQITGAYPSAVDASGNWTEEQVSVFGKF